ncbi:glucose-6-phosphate isomerase [Herminiimonas sp. CN]|uniref:glucose-6-phosphate isomerase n=1 Tax=Herminiimonas sp. CN TaxID=1349818 RepID=UPI0004740D7F|nr:glucose-6-phosphate isomerase [Herminiimonas sp. CN]
MPSLTASASFAALQSHFASVKNRRLPDLFAQNPQRFAAMSLRAAGLLLDYSKNLLTTDSLRLLLDLARERGVEEQRAAMFAGVKINTTEHRAALHVALRAPRDAELLLDGQDVIAAVHAVQGQMRAFTERVRSGQWLGHTGKAITDIVNIGIGGSDLGPKLACQALQPFAQSDLQLHFVSNADGRDLDAVLRKCNPETALFIVASKSFTTQETMLNAHSARDWMLQQSCSEAALARHFVALSTNTAAVRAFGIDPGNMFPFWDWVGGRYSVWSAIGLSIALAVGFDHFAAFLQGAHAMDQHFCSAPLAANMPVLLALVGIWNRNFLGSSALAIAPYQQDLNLLPAFLQQLEMESNGKGVALDGATLETASSPLILGNAGTNGQHAYFQLLHQGSDVIPVDFIAALRPQHRLPDHHAALLANCFAQSEALMHGKSAAEVRAEMQAEGIDEERIPALVPHRVCPGNRPSNMILMDALTPETLGALLALYEHKVFVQGVIWGVNSFDQWGVELGKALARNIQSELLGTAQPLQHDSSTNNLIALAKAAL